mgnify:CR=1 FL=1
MPPTAAAAARDIQFNWEGKDKKGNKIRGKILAVSEQAARADLRRQNIVATKVSKNRQLFSGGGKITPGDIAVFSRQLSTMLAAGIPLVSRVKIMAQLDIADRLRPQDGRARMQVNGNLTMDTVSALFKERLKPEHGGNLEIDFSGLEKVDSSAVSLMLVWTREARRSRIDMRFVNVPDNVVSLAKLYGVADLLTLADIGLLCSHEEGFSNAVLEGMAAGLPMVVTDVGGNKEAVLHGKTGYVVPARDSKALANALLALVNNREQAIAFGLAGQARVKAQFALETCVNAYIKLYEECLCAA